MNLEEVEAALQQVDNKLLTEREFQYIYFVSDYHIMQALRGASTL